MKRTCLSLNTNTNKNSVSSIRPTKSIIPDAFKINMLSGVIDRTLLIKYNLINYFRFKRIFYILTAKSDYSVKTSFNYNLSTLLKRISLVCFIFMLLSFSSFGATYTANTTGNWSSAATWSGAGVPGSGDIAIINSGITVTVDGTDACASLTINAPAAANGITISGTNSLTVGGAILMNTPTAAVSSTMAVGGGTLTAASITIPGGALANENCILSVSTGTVNVSGNITFSGTAAQAKLTFTGSGTLNIGGNLGAGGTFTASTGIVNFNGTVAQTFAGYNYNILKSNNSTGITPSAAPAITTLTVADVTSGSIFNDGGYTITTATTLNLNSGTYNCTAATFPWGTLNAGTGSVNYGLAGAQTVAVKPYYQLSISGTGIKTLSGVTSVSGPLVTTSILDLHDFAISAGDLQGNGTITSGVAGAVTVTTGGDNSSSTFSGLIQNGSGTVSLTKNGTGILTLSGANTFSGIFTINGGTVVGTSNAGALGAGSITLNSGILYLTNTPGTNLSFNRPVTISGNSQIISDVSSAGNGNTYTLGTLSIGNETLTLTGGNNVSGGTAGIIFGATTFTGTPTFSVNNPSNGGVTQLSVAAVTNGANQATINGNGNVIQTGIWGNGAGGILFNGTGVLTLNQANTYTGNLTINSGTVTGTSNAGAFGAGAASIILNGGILYLTNVSGTNLNFARSVTVNSNSQIVSDVNTAGAGNTYTLGTLSLGNQTLTLTGGNNVTGGTAGITFGAVTFSTGAPTFTINNPSSGGTAQLSVAAVNNGTYTATINGNGNMIQTGVWGNGSGGINIDGSGIITLSQANTYSGSTILNSGQLNINSATAIGTGPFVIGAGTTINNSTGAAITLTSNNIQTWNGNFTFTGTKSLNLGTGSVTMSNNCQVNVNANTLTIGGTITGSGSAYNLTLPGPGNFSLGANNVSVNNLTVNSGTFTAPSATLKIAGNFINSGIFTNNNGTVNYNGSVQQIAGVVYNNLIMSGTGGNVLQANTSVAGTLSLNMSSGTLLLGNYNLTLTGATGLAAISGTCSSTNMIETDGTGMLVFTNAGLTGASLNGTYPLGNNGDYNPVTISSLTGVAANRTFNIAVVSGQLFVDGINRYWLISQSGVPLTGTPALSFTYLASEASSDYTKYQPYTNITGPWTLAPGASTAGVNPMTTTLTTVLPSSSQWTASVPGAFYSYQTGSWNNPTTWTNDPSGTTLINPLNTYPKDLDNVVILPGRTVSLTANVTSASNNININAGGYLNLSTFQFTNSILSLSGQGTIQISPSNPVTGYFPAVITNTFINTGGGTVEYDASSNLPASPLSYNNLTINVPSGIDTLINNTTLNGNLWIEQGTLQINGNATSARYQLTINGNVTVNSGASFMTGRGNTTTTTVPTGINTTVAGPFINYYDGESHRIVVYGNFTNNGTVRFTNQVYPVYNAFPTNGFATIYFRGSTNNTLTCNGTTDFYNLVLDKGSDQTYILTVYSSAYNNFRLFGANTAVFDILMGASNSNPNIKKSLWVRNGTLDLTGLLAIPSLTEGSTAYPATPTSDYFIPYNGSVIIDAPFVTVLSTADDYTEVNAAYGLSGGSNALYGINTSGAGSSLSILGKLQVNNGYLSTRESSGLLYWSYASGQFIVNGGTVDTKQFHNPEGGATGLISYTQTGGNVIFRGRFQNTINYTTPASLTTPVINTSRNANGTDATAGIGTLSINNNVANGFTVSGGTMSFYDVCGTTAPTDAIYIGCPISNINVTGGTVQIIPTTGTVLPDANYLINTDAPEGNLIINQTSGASIVQLNTNPLSVLNNITLQSGTFDANGLNLDIGGNFSIASGTNYLCTGTSANRTIFNGSGNQTFTVNLTSPLSLNRLIIIKQSSGSLVFAGSQNTINLADSLMIVSGKLGDNGDVLNASGGVYNAGVEYGTGKIAMVGSNTQTIDGNGSGTFNNLDINNTNVASSPVSLTAAITVNGQLRLVSNNIFTIGSNKLNISASGSISSVPGFTNTCFIQTNGLVGDGGITKTYSSTASFIFPVGAYSTNRPSTYAYTPAKIGFTSAPSVYGSVTVIPVGKEDPNTTTKNLSLTYYWHVVSSGFTLAANSVTQSYTFAPADVNSTLNKYVPARFNETTFSWTSGTTASINTTTYTMGLGTGDPFFNNVNYIDGDYTAGNNNPTNPFGTPRIFYSYHCPAPTGGKWDSPAIWSLTSHTVYSNPSNLVPGANDIVLIGNKDSVYLGTANTVANTDVRSCATLQIEYGAALDIGYNPGCNFNVVTNNTQSSLGNGNFRLTTSWTSGSTYVFPSGDFSSYNTNLGTTELYSTNNASGTTYWLPQGVTTYGNLILSPLGGSNVIFGNNNLTIYGNLITRGQNADSWFCPTWNSAYPTAPTAVVAKTITINGNLLIEGGALIWYGNGALAQNFVIDGNVFVNTWGAIQNWGGAGSANIGSVYIGDSLINNTTNTIGNGASSTVSNVDFNTNGGIPVIFFGPKNAAITNSSRYSKYYIQYPDYKQRFIPGNYTYL